MFDQPIKRKLVRKGIYAYLYPNGNITILGRLYMYHSLTSAIRTFRTKFPKYKNR
jgi:hypothetical protein